jgi:anti-anti-sigma factor
MNISERKMNDVTVLDLDGRFALGSDRQFGHFVEANIQAGGRKLIVNLAKVVYMDSSGLGELVAGYRATGERAPEATPSQQPPDRSTDNDKAHISV